MGARAQNGLRGLMALHVALFHYLLVPSLKINTYGHAHMSCFMLLSGFGLSVAYGHKTIDRSAFWMARFARTMPLVYLTHAIAALLTPFGHGHHPDAFLPTLRNNIAATSMWLLHEGEPAWGWNGPAWTVSTLVSFYWVYPFLKPTISRLAAAPTVGVRARLAVGFATGLAIAHGVIGWLRPATEPADEPWRTGWAPAGAARVGVGLLVGAFTGVLAGSGIGSREAASLRLGMPPWLTLLAWLQFAIGAAMNFNGLPYIGAGYWPATGWAPSRLPLFLMGAVAGAVQVRADEGGAALGRRWAKRTDVALAGYIATLTACSAFEILKEACGWTLELHLGPLVQLAMPYVQLVVVVGLARSNESLAARVCLQPWCQWLGKISMALYL